MTVAALPRLAERCRLKADRFEAFAARALSFAQRDSRAKVCRLLSRLPIKKTLGNASNPATGDGATDTWSENRHVIVAVTRRRITPDLATIAVASFAAILSNATCRPAPKPL